MTNPTPPCRPGAQTTGSTLGAWLLVFLLAGLWDTQAADAVTGDQALQRLVEGNQRSVAGAWTHPHQSLERRAGLTKGQAPFAVILACADSRVSPEVLFDQGLGDLFVIRVAGNVIDNLGLGSLEYAAEHLHTPLIVVLGHTQCGAVQAAVAGSHAPRPHPQLGQSP